MQIINIERVYNQWISKTVASVTYEQLFSGLIITTTVETLYIPEPFTVTYKTDKFTIVSGGCRCLVFTINDLPSGMNADDVKGILASGASTQNAELQTLIFKMDISSFPVYEGVLYSNVPGIDVNTYMPNININLFTETGRYSSLKFSFDSSEFNDLLLLSFDAYLSLIIPIQNSGEYPPYTSVLTNLDPERRDAIVTPFIYEYSNYREFNASAEKIYFIAKFLKNT